MNVLQEHTCFARTTPGDSPGANNMVNGNLMQHITAAGNTEVPAYLSLLHEGFRVERQFFRGVEELWIAEKDDIQVSGCSPLEVLGLYHMRKQRGENWQADDSEIDAFMQRFYP